MTIVSSTIVEDSPQADGRRWIREQHTDHVGVVSHVIYMAEAGADTAPALAARAIQIAADQTAAELSANEGEVLHGPV